MVERDDGKPFPYVADEAYCLFCAHRLLARHASQRGVDFCQAVCSTATGDLIELNKSRQTGLMVDMISVEDRHEH